MVQPVPQRYGTLALAVCCFRAFLPGSRKMPHTGSAWDLYFGGFALLNILWH